MHFIEVHKQFATEEACHSYLEAMRWPDGVRCLDCGSERISKFTTKETTRKRFSKKLQQTVEVKVPSRHLYECLACRYQFAATTGTIFHDTHLPLTIWFSAIALIADAKKGMAAIQLQRHLGIGSYRTAWYLCHRIRKAMNESDKPKFAGPVEVDETYIGGKRKGIAGRGASGKTPVVGMRDRKTKRVRLQVMPDVTAKSLGKFIRDHAEPGAEVHTDQFQSYFWLRSSEFLHRSVNHIRTYVDGDVHTNGVENVWSLLKRAIVGNFHKVSIKHLHRYLEEFGYRFDNRSDRNLFERIALNLLRGEGMPYRELVSDPA